jgi:ABC-2 type transport system permease protein
MTIAKKEFTDHVTDKAFLLCFGILLIVLVGSAFYQIQLYSRLNVPRPAWMDIPEYLHEFLTSQISSLGALLAVALSFNSINKERSEGSLKVMLSYPIYRDKIILGKLIAGIIILALATTASMGISFAITFYYMSVPFTLDILLRVIAIITMSLILLTFFLCLGTAISTVIKDTATSLITMLLAIFLFRGETFMMALMVASSLVPGLFSFTLRNQYYLGGTMFFTTATDGWQAAFRKYVWMTPVETYQHFGLNIFKFYSSWASSNYISFGEQLTKNWDLVAFLIVFAIAAFAACYVLFTRREIT